MAKDKQRYIFTGIFISCSPEYLSSVLKITSCISVAQLFFVSFSFLMEALTIVGIAEDFYWDFVCVSLAIDD